VFDLQAADAPRFVARLANRLHARTRGGVIRSTLLVNPGDRYDSARVAESERALRNLNVFSRVRIDTTRLDGRLALRIATTDGEAASERVLLFRDGVPDTTRFSRGQVERRALWFGLTAGFAPRVTTEDYVRLWLAGQWRRENFDSVGTTAFPRSVFGTVGVGM